LDTHKFAVHEPSERMHAQGKVKCILRAHAWVSEQMCQVLIIPSCFLPINLIELVIVPNPLVPLLPL